VAAMLRQLSVGHAFYFYFFETNVNLFIFFKRIFFFLAFYMFDEIF
jgi:hypothetical protein